MRIHQGEDSDGVAISERLEHIWQSSTLSELDVLAGQSDSVWIGLSRSRRLPDHPNDSAQPSRRFLVASLTKPVVAMLAMQLVCDGLLTLSERAERFLPEMRRSGMRSIRVRQLLTHTSGLPDMLPDNQALRAAHTACAEFAAAAANGSLEFPPGTDCRYSSMAFAVLGQVIETVTGEPLSRTLHDRVFRPLGMLSSWLGIPDTTSEVLATVLPCELPPWQPAEANWNWNSPYWRRLGAPWGGLITTATDLGRLARALLNGGLSETGSSVLNPTGLQRAVLNQLEPCAEVSESTRRTRSWGFGWRHNWLDHSACFSDLLPSTAVGHWGATGTLWWLDPQSSRWAVILTTTPYDTSRVTIQQLSNVIAAARRE